MTSPGPARWPLYVILAAMIVVSYSFFRMTWFGVRLSDEALAEKIESDKARDIQHALEELSRRIEEDKAKARPFYDRVLVLERHAEAPVRNMAAWVMGQDNEEPRFRDALGRMLEDEAIVVRYNAACGLTRFADDRARPVLLQMLEPRKVLAPASGKVEDVLGHGLPVEIGRQVARIAPDEGDLVVVRSPLDGSVYRVVTGPGARVESGDEILSIAPNDLQLLEALKGLFLVGRPEDLPAIEPFERGVEGRDPLLQTQARRTAEAIRDRTAPPK